MRGAERALIACERDEEIEAGAVFRQIGRRKIHGEVPGRSLKPLVVIAERTRSLLSFIAASARPTTLSVGRP